LFEQGFSVSVWFSAVFATHRITQRVENTIEADSDLMILCNDVLNMFFFHCLTHLVERKGIWLEKTGATLSQRVLFQNIMMRKKTPGEPASPVLPGKQPLKWRWWYFRHYVVSNMQIE